MKIFFFTLLTGASLYAGFFVEPQSKTEKNEINENERLCMLFTKKAVVYEKEMREDELAKRTLISYKERAARFCKKAKESSHS